MAYIEQVESIVNGSRTYSQIRGWTGHIGYPAGFVYVFIILSRLTNYGVNTRHAQYIFCYIYLINLALVLRIYSRSKKVGYLPAIHCTLLSNLSISRIFLSTGSSIHDNIYVLYFMESSLYFSFATI